MLIKEPDDRTEELAKLERLADSMRGAEKTRALNDLRIWKAGLKAEQDAAYLIDFHFAKSRNNAVIHDLRLECDERVAQIDHLIISRRLYCYVLESKSFRSGIKISEEGEFLRWDPTRHTYEGIPSPIAQNERHIAVLGDAMRTLDLPSRFGIRISPRFHSFVLISDRSRILRPERFDTSHVVKADQFAKKFAYNIDHEAVLATLASFTKLVSSRTVRDVAEQLVDQHRPMPLYVPSRSVNSRQRAAQAHPAPPQRSPAPEPTSATTRQPQDQATAKCKHCGGTKGVVLNGRYGYYFKCAACGKNTAVRFQCLPGHHPRLRKVGTRFYRECPECVSVKLYFVNADTATSAHEAT